MKLNFVLQHEYSVQYSLQAKLEKGYTFHTK